MPLRARVDRHRCIGAGTCITIAPTAFDWHEGDFAKSGVVDPAGGDASRPQRHCPSHSQIAQSTETGHGLERQKQSIQMVTHRVQQQTRPDQSQKRPSSHREQA